MLKLLDEQIVPYDSSSGLYATQSIVENGVIGVGDQFLAGAQDYDDRYVGMNAMISKLRGSFDIAKFDRQDVENILDIGCGSGNATMALATMFPDAKIVATDLSPNLLEILAKKTRATGIDDRVSCIIADASTIKLKPQSFDIICGSSMLHHLDDPEAVLNGYISALSSDGIGLFYEPFHVGYFVLRQILVGLIHLAKFNKGIPEADIAVFNTLIYGIDFVSAKDRSDPVLKNLDDKWLFSREMFKRVAEKNSRTLFVYTANPAHEGYQDKISNMLFSVTGNHPDWPAWAVDYFKDIDNAERGELANDVLMEGCIVFK
ncbi:trans-aconitate 2-methyltransferase [Rhizobium lusitanum]|uniref:class I SAM-dependent methyltransferase n=1 Tax=Rhizobium lusitanum TaxID=293958 RepID=UPI001957CEA5|nr:class I SAM-dependent methyltransferase [Rhizobium lusitanum]MBM7047587.1 class I SAM-dependent methyltransferase [Rhizobium lusitanum]